jgi:threonine/homoserine/homoserine lactone efflux protein
MRAGAALWIALPSYHLALAWRFWTSAPAAAGQRSLPMTPRQVFLATLLNPKLAVFALVVFPTLPTWGAAAPFAAGFGVAAALEGGLWLCRGLPR